MRYKRALIEIILKHLNRVLFYCRLLDLCRR
nr:MAG TPA: hypothetical protein [Caudoviricetes sp.]